MSNIYMWARGRLYLFYFFQKHEILQSFYEVLFFTRPSRKGALHVMYQPLMDLLIIIIITDHHHHLTSPSLCVNKWLREGKWEVGEGEMADGRVCVYRLKKTSFSFYSDDTGNVLKNIAMYFSYSDTQHDMYSMVVSLLHSQ